MKNELSRRGFIGTISAATLGVAATGVSPTFITSSDAKDQLAILGGPKSHKTGWQG